MERIPNGRYMQEFRKEAVKMVTDGGLSVLEVSKRLFTRCKLLDIDPLFHWESQTPYYLSRIAKQNMDINFEMA
jgi:hypothetical protein